MAKSTNGVEVARISVKVSPNTKEFHSDLRRRLQAIERRLAAEGVDAGDVNVNTSKAEKKVAKSSKKMKNNLGALTKEAKKASTAVSKIKLNDVSKDIARNANALDVYSGKFDVKKSQFWDPKEAKSALKAYADDQKRRKALSDMAVGLANSGGPFLLTGNTKKLNAAFDKSVDRMQDKLDTLDLKWDKKVRDFEMGLPELSADLGDARAELERTNEEFRRMKRIANRSSLKALVAIDESDKKTLRYALREYALGFRDIGYAAQKARVEAERFGGFFGKKYGIQSGRDQLRARGGLTGALLGGVAGMAALKGGTDLIKGLGKSVGKLPGMFGDAGNAAGGFFGKMKNFKKLIPKFGTGLNLAAYGVIIAGITLLAAPLIGLVTSALMTLPGLIGLVVAPIAGVMLALDGIKEAAKVLEEPFKKMRENLSAIAKEQFTPMFEAIGKIFPSIEKTMPSVTQGLADIGTEIANFFNQGEGQVMLEETITGIGDALTKMAPGVRDFVAALTDLANKFVNDGALDGLGDWFNETMEDFRNWVATEDITAMFEGLGDTLKIIMDWLGDIAQSGLDFVKDPSKMDGFLKTLEDIGEVLEDIVDLSNTLSGVWDAFAFGGDLLSDNLDRGADFFRDAESFLTGGNTNFWDSLLPDDWTRVAAKAEEGGRAAKLAFQNGLDDVQDDAFDQSILSGTGIDLNNLTEPVSDNIANIAADIAAAGTEGQEALQNALDTDEVSVGVAQQVEGQVAAAVSGALVAVEPLKEELQGKINSALEPLALVTSRADTAFKDAAGALETALGTSLDNVAGKFETTADRVSTALGRISSSTAQEGAGALRSLATDAQSAMTDMETAVTTGSDNVVSTLTDLPGRMSGAMGDVSGTLVPAGEALMGGLAAGIESGFEKILARVSTMADEVAANKGPIPHDKTVLIPNGEALMEGLGKGMENGFAPILDQAKGLADKVSAAFANGEDPTAALAGYSETDIKRIQKALDLQGKIWNREIKVLETRAKYTGDESLKAEAERLRMMREELALQEDMIGLSREFNDFDGSSGGGEDPFVKGASQLMNSPVDFAKATGKQFMTDLGIGGDGLIGNAITEGISYIFNIASVDDAMSLKDRQDSKSLQSAVGR